MEADFQLHDAAARFADLLAAGHMIDVALEAPLLGTPRLIACAHCRGEFFRKAAQRFCSRSCAALARPPRTPGPRKPRTDPGARWRTDPLILRLLELSPFEQGPDGRWRFGTRAISTHVVARLIASGRAEIVARRLQLVPQETGEPA